MSEPRIIQASATARCSKCHKTLWDHPATEIEQGDKTLKVRVLCSGTLVIIW